MDDLIGNLQSLARMQNGMPTLSLAVTALDGILRQAVDLLAPIAEQRRATIRLEIDHPPAVRCDAQQVLRVLSNLLGNAIRFTPPGESITVSASAADDEVTIAVLDRGPGIPPSTCGACSIRTGRVGPSTARWAWAWRSRAGSWPPTAARSGSRARPAGEPVRVHAPDQPMSAAA